MKDIEKFFRFLLDVPKATAQERRWGNYLLPEGSPEDARETVTEHLVTTALLAKVMIGIEDTHPHFRYRGMLDAGTIMTTALLHDIGEGEFGDKPWAYMQTVEGQHDHRTERDFVVQLLTALPDFAGPDFLRAYALESDKGDLNGRFFQAVETMGYMVCAITRYRDGQLAYLECLQNQHSRVLEMAKEFISVEVLYAPFQDWVEEQIDLPETS